MNHVKSESYYQELASKLNEIVPVDWDVIKLRSEVEEGAVELIYWFQDSTSKEYVQNFDLVSKYGVNRKIEKITFMELTDIVKKIHSAIVDEGNDPFTVVSFTIDNSGKYKINYEYTDLSESTVLERRELWMKNNF